MQDQIQPRNCTWAHSATSAGDRVLKGLGLAHNQDVRSDRSDHQLDFFLVRSEYCMSATLINSWPTQVCPPARWNSNTRDPQIPKRGRLRVRDFLNNTEVLAREPASFWRENALAVVIFLRVLTKLSQWRMLEVLSIILCDGEKIGEGSTSFNNNCANFLVSNSIVKLSGLNLALVVFLVLESPLLC